MKNLILILIFTIGFIPLSMSAQVRDGDVAIMISPQYPGPNENVRITLSSQVVDLSKSLITWSINGENKAIGIGKKEFEVNSGTLGGSIRVEASIDTLSQASIKKIAFISPMQIDMLWQAEDSYVPPFYKGKSLVPSEGRVKVVAIPAISASGIKPKNFSYVWTKDGNTLGNVSGWGKNSFTYKNTYLESLNKVSVKVSDITETISTLGEIDIRTANPKIVFYKRDPLFGTNWNRAVSGFSQISSEGETFVVEPYFFSGKNIESSELSIDWFINGQKVSDLSRKNILPLKPQEGQSGSATIRASVENRDTLFQEMEKEITVGF